jgi:hypothetical protein
MKVNPDKFLQLEEELKAYRPALNQAIPIILQKAITQYPIFIAHQDSFAAGIPIINRYEVNGNWNINVSSLEEFVKKKIISAPKIEAFKRGYKNPEDFICFFVLSELGAQFIYLPRII